MFWKKKHSGRHCLLQTSSTISVNQVLSWDPSQTVFYNLDIWSLSQTNPKKRCSTILLKSIPPQSCPIQPSSSISVNQVFQSRPLLRLKSMKAGLSAILKKGTNVSFKTIGCSRIMYFGNVFHNIFFMYWNMKKRCQYFLTRLCLRWKYLFTLTSRTI